MKRMLFISNFPFSVPLHGGQIRSNELYKKYRELGFDVKVLVIKPRNSYLDQKADYIIDIDISEFAHYDSSANELLHDLFCDQYVKENIDSIIKKIGTNYDMIHCEMPWLFFVAHEIKARSKNKTYTILGTENIESILKTQILKKAKVNHTLINEIETKIQSIEYFACEHADLVYVVSQNDFDYFSKSTNSSKIVLIPNGVDSNRFKKVNNNILKELPKKYFTFVGSAHLPNASGFLDVFSKSLGFLPPDIKIVIVGGVGDILRNDPRYIRYRLVNDSRILTLKNVSFEELDAVLLNSLAILLPVVEGGGTNLKTAEALLSNNRIIATSKSFNGYEAFKTSENIFIANTTEDFVNSMKQSFEKSGFSERSNLEMLTWDNHLKIIKEKVSEFYV